MSKNIEILRDPANKKSKLYFNDGILQSETGESYKYVDNVPNLIFPRELTDSDKEYNVQYAQIASMYDTFSAFLFEMVFEDQEESRGKLVTHLNLKQGDKVLEVSTGTGLNVHHILKAIGDSGEAHLLDLSKDMLQVAINKFKDEKNVFYYLGNGSNLPFADETFDALLHVGGINTFSDIESALKEFARVTKKGGKVIISDEGIMPNLLKTEYGKLAIRFNGLYKEKPPMDKLPSNAREVSLHYVAGGIFYVIEFIVGEEYKFNMDLPYPMSDKTLKDHFDEMIEKYGEIK